MMKFPLAFVLVAGVTLSGFAQQSSTYKVKRSTPEKPPKSTVPLPKTSNAGTSSAATSKELQSVERETAKSTTPAKSNVKTAPTATRIKPAKDKPNTPINFGGVGNNKKTGPVTQSSNPYKGRLKQKNSSQQ